MKKILFFAFVMMVAVGAGKSFAYTVPEDDTNVEFMYVTGPEGDPLRGAEDHTLTLNIDVPEDEEGAVKIGIYDPDTGGDVDARIDGTNSWDTKTVITLSGKDGEISKKKFTDNDNYDSKFVIIQRRNIRKSLEFT
ncbi:MAG: hypothetical protein HON76_17005 [Candidatus Scalindua sp.]|nr:hypothetical protein [Candidatus Scalindua sp.]MBT6227566.1 hypothetical protein [Candidatus Scalindua sp.]MBT6564217.1 hypothetical protein [Candidatus Scalindua sp.]